jgi:Uma2 family endonuclease
LDPARSAAASRAGGPGASVDSVVQLRRWTREEYERLAEVGLLGPNERVELIEGEIVAMPPQRSQHAIGVCLAQEAFGALFRTGFSIRIQLPLALGPRSEPEPDVAVVVGMARDFVAAHPTSALLVLEVSDTTLSFDRETKGSLYAAAGIPEYWIVDLVHRQLEVYREPGPMPETRFGFGYRSRTVVLPGQSVLVPGPSEASLAVDELLP